MNKRHGMSRQRIHNIWCSMRQRCEQPGCSGYWKYGAKGIRVCEEWQMFENFMNWALANGYAEDLSIDRIDSSGNYEPSNCRWVTQKVQQNNRSNNVKITYNGETHNVEEWEKITGIPYRVIYDRNHRGWTPERIFQQKKRRSPTMKKDEEKEKTSTFRIYYDESDDPTVIITAAALIIHDGSIMERISGKYGRNDAISHKFPDGTTALIWANATGIVIDFRKKSFKTMYYDKLQKDRGRD